MRLVVMWLSVLLGINETMLARGYLIRVLKKTNHYPHQVIRITYRTSCTVQT